jgi:hypothetical protein
MPVEVTGAPTTGTENSPATTPEKPVVAAAAPVGEGAQPGADAEAPSTPATEAPASTASAQAAVDEDAYWSWYEKQDPAALMKRHRGLAGKVGELADRQAKKLRDDERKADEEHRREEDARKAQQEFEEAVENDPYKLQDLTKKALDGRRKATEAEGHRKAILGEWDARIERMFLRLPDDVKEALSGKQYNAKDDYEARTAFLEDIIEHLGRHHGSKELEKQIKEKKKEWEADWEKERLPVLRQSWLGESNGNAPSPDSEGGGVPAGDLTWDVFKANKDNPTWRRENRDRIDRLLAKQPPRFKN